VSVHGRLQEGESAVTALVREAWEELGSDAGGWIREHEYELRLVSHPETDTEDVATYSLRLPCTFLSQVQLGSASGGLRLITPEEAKGITDLRKFDKTSGVPSRVFASTGQAFKFIGKLTAMFPDEREAVQKVLGVFTG